MTPCPPESPAAYSSADAAPDPPARTPSSGSPHAPALAPAKRQSPPSPGPLSAWLFLPAGRADTFELLSGRPARIPRNRRLTAEKLVKVKNSSKRTVRRRPISAPDTHLEYRNEATFCE